MIIMAHKGRDVPRSKLRWYIWIFVTTGLIAFSNVSAAPFRSIKDSSHEDNCFSCNDKCQNLSTIYHNNILMYERNLSSKTFPKCSETTRTPGKCDVCTYNSDTNIYCSEDVTKIDVETTKGEQFDNLPHCPDQNIHDGAINCRPSFLIVVGLLLFWAIG